jgi:hypothetical protein
MTLHSPSRTSSVFRSVAPGRQVTVDRSLRPSSRRFACPFDAPSPRNPLPDRVSSPGATVRLSPLAGAGRLVTTRIVAIPPCLVAGFHPRFGPPPPFLTTLAACSSSNPVECFVHSRPWGSVPGSLSRVSGRLVRGPVFPALVRPNFTEVRSGRTQGASCRAGGSRSTPHRTAAEASTRVRGHRSDRSSSATEVAPPSRKVRLRLPDPSSCLLRALTTEVVIRPDCRSLQPPSEEEDLLGRRGGEPSRPSSTTPCRGCLSYPVRPPPRMSWADIGSPGASPLVRAPEGVRRLEPACAPGRFASRRIGRLRLASSTPFPRCRPRGGGRVSPGLLATRTQSICQ